MQLFQPLDAFELQDVKNKPLTENQLVELERFAGSYSALINRKAQIIKSKGIQIDGQHEAQLKTWLLQEYTLLKRPVIIIEDQCFIGNAPNMVSQALQAWQSHQLQRK